MKPFGMYSIPFFFFFFKCTLKEDLFCCERFLYTLEANFSKLYRSRIISDKEKTAITLPNMKYKIQNHFAHNDAQVFPSQKCISVFLFHVKREYKKKSVKEEPTAKFSSQRLNCSGWRKVCRSSNVYAACRQETDFNVCVFFYILSSACTPILCMYEHAKWHRMNRTDRTMDIKLEKKKMYRTLH